MTVFRNFATFALLLILAACGPTVSTTTGETETTDYSTVDILSGQGPTTSLSQPGEKIDYPYVGGGEQGLGWPYEVRPLTFNNSQIVIMGNGVIVQPDTAVAEFEIYLPANIGMMEQGDTLTLTFGAHILNLTKEGSGETLNLKKVGYQGELSNYKTVKVTFHDQFLMSQPMSEAYQAAVTAQGH